jgi:hypothetical protein
MTDKPDYVIELRTIARLIETKTPVAWREQDATQLCKAADEIERLREAVCAERAAILELIESERANAHLYDGDYTLRTAWLEGHIGASCSTAGLGHATDQQACPDRVSALVSKCDPTWTIDVFSKALRSERERESRLGAVKFGVLTDARINPVKAASQLTPDQKKFWLAIEDAIRARAKDRQARIAAIDTAA